MGHGSIRGAGITLNRYTHVLPEDIERAVACWPSIWTKP
jgi:hypothetical protein